MQWFPRDNHACFYCSATGGPEDRRHQIPIFTLAPCAQRFLQFVRLYHALHLMRCSKSSQFYIKERYSETVMNFCSSLLLKLCLSNTPIILYPIMLTICCQLTKLVVKCSPSCFFLVPLTIPAFCCSHPNFFETCWSHQTQNNNKFIRSDKFSVFYCEFEKKVLRNIQIVALWFCMDF